MTSGILITISIDEFKSIVNDTVLKALEQSNKPQEPPPEDELIKIKEVAKLLKVSLVTIHSYKKKGLIPFHRISNKIYFKKNEVLEALKKIERKGF